MHRTTRISARGVLRDDSGRVLVQQGTENSGFPGSWLLPGGGVEHAEDPAAAVVREFAEETGLRVTPVRPLCADSRTTEFHADWMQHSIALVYEVKLLAGELLPTADGRNVQTNLWRHSADLNGEPMGRSTATALGIRAGTLPAYQGSRRHRNPSAADLGEGRQRLGSYAWLTAPDGRVLMTRISPGFWGAGCWHLPGGGVDFGERPTQSLLREISEETGQDATLGPLRLIHSGYDPADNVHGIGVVYRAHATNPSPLEIRDTDGSTCEVRWMEPRELANLTLTSVAADAWKLWDHGEGATG